MKNPRKPPLPNGMEISPFAMHNARLLHELQVYEAELEQQNDELRDARNSLELAVERYSSLFDFAPVGYFILNRDGTIAKANLAGARLLGMSREQISGKPLRNFVATNYWGDFDRLLKFTVLTDETQACELAMLRDDAGLLIAHLEARLDRACNEFMIVLVDVTERQLAGQRLQAANSQLAGLAHERALHLQTLSGELTRAEQRERDSLYELLHDNVQPLLVAARLGLSGLSRQTAPEDALATVAEATEQLSQVIQTIRTLSIELSPPLIRERGLLPALESLSRWMQSNYGLKVDIGYATDAEPESMTIRLLCFKAVRELLMNVVKYAGTRQAVLDLRREGSNMLRITVSDDGEGFDPDDCAGSGLANIERRLGMVGGKLLVKSLPNAGTVATILVPAEIGAADRRIEVFAGRQKE